MVKAAMSARCSGNSVSNRCASSCARNRMRRVGFSPSCDPGFTGGTGRFPQVSGLKVTYACNGTTPVVTGMWKAPFGGPLTPIGPADTVRLVTNDFMYTGGDGYTVLTQATDVLLPLDDLLDVVIQYITANSPVAPVVEGRIDRQ
jgi:2',3'-cyclic-nucleotide 2'-phosphodiesterase (5'-nucleotidase family)